MAVYTVSGSQLSAIYNRSGAGLSYAYDLSGTEIFSGQVPEEPFDKTLVRYDRTDLITNAWLANAETQRNAVLALYNQSSDAIPFFLQTDGHGRRNEGNKGAHNLAEPVMRYIWNIQLGDYASYYADGANASHHISSSAGLTNYIPVMGNHEFLNNDSASSQLADLSVLVPAFTPTGAILGSEGQGYYKIVDAENHLKFLVTQPFNPDATNSSGFVAKYPPDEWRWIIGELSADDGCDIVVLSHYPFYGYYIDRSDGTTHTSGNPGQTSGFQTSLSTVLADRKAKRSGSVEDVDGNVYTYDFTGCTTDLLCCLHGHIHAEWYFDKTQYGYPAYVGDDFDGSGKCAYGLIDRDGGKLYIYSFTKSEVSEPLVLTL